MKEIIELFLGVLDKNENQYFRNFLKVIPEKSSWYLIGDYCIDDSTKYNDVITFSLLCNYSNHKDIKDLISSLASRDLKKTKDIDVSFTDYLNSPYLYHFSLVVTKKEKLLAEWLNKVPIVKMLAWMHQVYEDSKKVDIERVDYYNDVQKRLKLVSLEVQKQGCNRKLIREILLTSSLCAAVIYMLKKYSSPTHIAWVSDRDAIIDKFDGFVFDNMLFWYKIVTHEKSFAKVDPEFTFVEPEKAGKNYFDELIRIPDYITGSLASIDIENKENLADIKDKYKQMFISVFSNPFNQATIKAECRNNGLSVYNFKWLSKSE